jgi:hypothetical protein
MCVGLADLGCEFAPSAGMVVGEMARWYRCKQKEASGFVAIEGTREIFSAFVQGDRA